MERKRIGFIGLGLMGYEMVRNLLSHGFQVIGYDIDRNKVDAVIELGGKGLEDPEQLAAHVEIIILSLPNSYIVDDVVTKSLKLFETGAKGLILIDTTTADPVLSESLAVKLRKREIEMLDATIIGGPQMFAEKEVTLMVGGEKHIYDLCKSIFNALSNQIFYVGSNGQGAQMKLMVNMVGGLNRMVLAEALSLSEKAGLDKHLLLEVLKNSAHYSRAMGGKGDRMVERDFLPPQGKLAFHLKDVQLMLDLGKRLNFSLPLSSLHAQALTSLVEKGRGEWDNTAIISYYEEK